MNDAARQALDAQRRRYEDQLAQRIHYDTFSPVMRRPMNGSYKSNGITITVGGGKGQVLDFMAGISKQRQRRADYLLNVPKEPIDDYHRLAFSRAIRVANESGTHRGIYGF
jgi:hypothetical protein